MSQRPKHQEDYSEKRPLLVDSNDLDYSGKKPKVTAEVVVMKRHVTLFHAVGMIVGGVAGSGIFISPTGVTKNVGSVGLSLIIWAIGGLLNLLLALCYAELGTALPFAGGDYAYMFHILGPLPAFLGLWTTVLLIGPCCGALMGRTVGTYVFSIFGVECSEVLVVLMAVIVNVSSAVLNCLSVKWAARIITIFSVGKLVALSVIIITGIVVLASGDTQMFDNMFVGSKTDTWSLVGGFLPGFIAYVGWDAVNSLAEEMKNPGRDLPLSVGISMILVIIIYIATNMAYFTVLSPAEFVASDAVATTFAERVLGPAALAVPVVVAMSAGGSAIGAYLAYPRFAFAGGREKQFPKLFSFVSLYHFTPIPGIILMLFCAVAMAIAENLNIQDLLAIGSIANQIKMVLVLLALLLFKYRQPNHPRTVKVPFLLVVLALLILIAVLFLAVIEQPLVNGIGLLLFLIGIPMYYLGNWISESGCLDSVMEQISIASQLLFYLVPGGRKS